MPLCNTAARLIALGTVVALPTVVAGDNWPTWRGPGRNGVSLERSIPINWSAEEGIAWSAELIGSGISSPVIWDERVIVTASDGPRQSDLHCLCLSRDDGRVIWQRQLWGTAPTRYHSTKSSMASPTPVTDGQFVFAFYGTGDLFCLTLDGGLVWHRSLASEYGRFENRFSATSSPILHGDSVIVQCDHYGDSYIVAVDRATGRNLWKVDRPETWLSWASPQLVSVANSSRKELVVCAAEKIEGLDPETGDTLWMAGGLQRECIPTPIIHDGLIYAVSGPKGHSMAIRPGGVGDISESHVLWRNQRGTPFVPSPIVVGDRYFLVDDQGIATCLRIADGKLVWQKRLGGAFTASPISAEGRIYFMDEAGTTTVIDASSDDGQVIAKSRVGEPIYASAAIAQGSIFLRTARRLLRITGRPSTK